MQAHDTDSEWETYTYYIDNRIVKGKVDYREGNLNLKTLL